MKDAQTLVMFLLSHHSSRIFFVSGQAQQALHFGFSPGAVVLASGVGIAAWIGGLAADAVFPILILFDFTGRQ